MYIIQKTLIYIVKALILCHVYQNNNKHVSATANSFSFRGHSTTTTSQYNASTHEPESFDQISRIHQQLENDNKLSSSSSITSNQSLKQHHSKIVIQAVNTASTFTANAQISTAQNSAVNWQLYYLDRLSIECTGLGLNTFVLATSGSNWWYNYICVTPGFTSTTTAYSNLIAVQGGQIPVYNNKFFQYFTSPNIADCR